MSYKYSRIENESEKEVVLIFDVPKCPPLGLLQQELRSYIYSVTNKEHIFFVSDRDMLYFSVDVPSALAPDVEKNIVGLLTKHRVARYVS